MGILWNFEGNFPFSCGLGWCHKMTPDMLFDPLRQVGISHNERGSSLRQKLSDRYQSRRTRRSRLSGHFPATHPLVTRVDLDPNEKSMQELRWCHRKVTLMT